jgi:hypothetical protein
VWDPEDPEKLLSQTTITDYADDSDDEYIDEANFDFARLDSKVEVKLGNYHPDYEYLVVVPGLNLKGMCQTPGCKANGQKTWVRLGFGTFDIGKAKHNSLCPCCQKKVNPKTILTLGYRNTHIEFEGAREKGDDYEDYKWKDDETKGLFRYFVDFDERKCKWEYLQVTTKPLEK